MNATLNAGTRELDRRTGDGLDVRLLWNPDTDRVSITVEDIRGGESFELEVEGADAIEAFHHPYSYASRTHLHPALAA